MFVFKFEKLLSIKENMLKKCMIEIATITAVIETYTKKKMELELERERIRQKLDKELSSSSISRAMVMFLHENMVNVESKINWLTESIENLKKQKKEKIEEAKEINREKKKLERLKEKAYEEYLLNEKRKEMRFLDEIANIKTARGTIEH